MQMKHEANVPVECCRNLPLEDTTFLEESKFKFSTSSNPPACHGTEQVEGAKKKSRETWYQPRVAALEGRGGVDVLLFGELEI